MNGTKVNGTRPVMAHDDQEAHLVVVDGLEEWHVYGCPCETCRPRETDYEEQTWAAWTELEDFNELGFAHAFVARFDGQGDWEDRSEYRFDSRRGRWMLFMAHGPVAGRWMPAPGILNAVGRLIARICEEKQSAASKWGKVIVYRNTLTLAQEHLTVDQWDTDGGLLGLPNGDLWDLERGYSQPNFRRLPVTKTTGVDPAEFQPGPACRGGCTCLWHSFLSDVTGGDEDMAKHLQLSIGAALYGGNRDHRLNVVCGDGGTGKSLFLNTIGAALGDYAGAMPPSVLASKSNDHPTGLAGVVDKRFVVVPEVSGGMWKEETLKTITGGDAIPVRYMRQDFFVVKPDCTLWASTNQPPALRMVDEAIKRRLRIWPFTHKPDEVDPRLGEKLQEPAMMGLVLQWALEGAENYARIEGELPDCDAVKDATRDYFSDVDTIGAWLEASTTQSLIPEHDTGAAAAYTHYEAWCLKERQKATTRTAWGTSMSRRIGNHHTSKGKVYAIELEDDGSMAGQATDPSYPDTAKPATKQASF